MKPSIKIEGVEELEKKFKKINRKTKGELSKHIEDTTSKVKQEAKRSAPERTGNLKKGIQSQMNRDGLSGVVESKAPHSHLVEFGTKPRRHKSGKSTGKMPKNKAFLFPAAEKEKDDYIRGVKKAFKRL